MYKISEEDSQDEEVLNSLNTKVSVSSQANNNNNGTSTSTTTLRVKPIPPAKPAFLRKAVVTGFGGVGNNANNQSSHLAENYHFSPSSLRGERQLQGSSASDLAKARHPTAIQVDVGHFQDEEDDQTSGHQDWPSSTETQTGDSEQDSEEVSVLSGRNDNVLSSPPVVVAGPTPSTSQLSSSSYKKIKRHKKRGEGGVNRLGQGTNINQVLKEEEEEEDSTQSEGSFCSSCDERESDHSGGGGDHDYDDPSDEEEDGSYYDGSSGHHGSGSDLDFDSESDTLFEEELASLLTEAEIQSWSRGDGNVLLCELCEYVSATNTNGPEISESANEKSGGLLHSSKSAKSIPHPPSTSSNSLGGKAASGSVPEIGFRSRIQYPKSDDNNLKGNKKGTKGKISRLLKRGSKTKQASSASASSAGSGQRCSGEGCEMDSIISTTTNNNINIAVPPPPTESSKMNKVSNNNTRKGANKVFRFKDEHEGEIRLVELFIRSYSKHNLGRRATMVESLLGIVPSRFSSKTANDRSSNSFSSGSGSSKKEAEDKRIMVAGFIPDGPAARNKQIKIGDWLQRVNGISVDFSNANAALLQILEQETVGFESPLKVSLELQRVSGYTVTDAPTTKTVTFGDMVQDGNSNEKSCLKGVKPTTENDLPHEIMSKTAIIYISVVNTTPPLTLPKEKTKDVIFAWPAESESRKVKAIAASHGMFSTLYKLLKDVTGSHPILSRVMIDEEEMDVVYSSDDEGKGLLLFATATSLSNFNICHSSSSSSCSFLGGESCNSTNSRKGKKLRWKDPVDGGLSLAQRLMTRVELLLKFQFGSLSRAFRNTPDEKLNHFFMEALGGLHDISEDFLFPQVPDFFLRIPPRIRCTIDERLYSFETSDSFTLCYGRNLAGEMEKPLFNCLGSCLYYKGMPVASHFERKLGSHFHGWWRTQLSLWSVKRNTLPYLWEPVKRLVLWQETFLLLDQDAAKTDGESLGGDKNSSSTSCQQSSVKQCCSGLVGIGNYMLGMILEPAAPAEIGVLKPDLGWIQRGFNCLLRILKNEIHHSLERWILSQEKEFIELYPPPGSASKTFLSGTKTSNHFTSSSSSIIPPSGILKNSAEPPPPPPSAPLSLPVAANLTSASSFMEFATSNINMNVGQHGLTPMLESLTINTGLTNKAPHEGLMIQQPQQQQQSSSLRDYSYHYGLSNSTTSAERLEMNYGGSNDEEELEETTTGTGSDTSSLKWCLDDSSRFSEGPLDEEIKTVSITKGNVLFDFIQIEAGRCVLLSSKDTLEGPFSVVVHNFRQSATLTHHILHKAANGRIRLSRQMSDKKWVSKALTPISEHGVLFNCDVVDPRDMHKKKPRLRQVSYWVIGRMYPNQREVYLCYQDSPVAQNLIEVGFKLAYYSV